MAKGRRKDVVSESELNRRLTLSIHRWNSISSIIRYLIVCGTICLSAYVAIYLPIQSSHGKTTTINYILNWIVDLKVDVIIVWGSSAACASWAIIERRKRIKERKVKDERIIALERKIDPNRSSSNLTVDGSAEDLNETGSQRS